MAIIESENDMFLKCRAIIELLAGQVTILDMDAEKGLKRYLNNGDNKKPLIEGFYAIIEAVEKVEMAQQAFKNEKESTELSKFIQKLKQEFKAMDLTGTEKLQFTKEGR